MNLEPFLFSNFKFIDDRGKFNKLDTKVLNLENFNFDTLEIFWTVSKKSVIRGLHFQNPPHDHNKIVTCIAGEIFDVVLDLRNCRTFGKLHYFALGGESSDALFIPKGFAHGFQSLKNDSTVLYLVDKPHHQDSDSGININSLSIPWPLAGAILSNRDKAHMHLSQFNQNTFN